ncbi:hypothetical protein [uncultured Bacteroides sp.]|uniref:hypothetical protein n=1 Tax=uncultured Bacteroides sp. TaxID=162156 RepID=UPI002635EFC1|nr:hypothetical protein [uncultured Bacteroides sp.]
MMTKTYIIPLIALLTWMCLPAAADNVRTEWIDSTQVKIAYSLTGNAERNYAICATPVLTDRQGHSLSLPGAVFRSKANRRYVERGRLYGTEQPAVTREPASGDTLHCEQLISRTDVPWLWQGPVRLDVQREREGCCQVEEMPSLSLGSFCYVPPFVPRMADVAEDTGKAGELKTDNPVLHHISEYRPYDKTRILRKEEGTLYVHFPLDRSLLDHSFRNNASTLDRIVELTRAVMEDSTSSVKIIQIVGLASVEGPQRRNNRLSTERAEALKSYIQQRVPTPDSLYECAYGGEAWAELRDQIADSDFEGRDKLLHIIDTESEPDRREALIKRLDNGRPYSYLKENVLSDQRNSGYLRIYYDYVPDTAAGIINEASALLREGRDEEALRKLLTVKEDRRAQNALGVAYYRTGQAQLAEECFRKAAADGNPQAADNLRQIEAIREATDREIQR